MINKKAVAILGAILLLIIGTVGFLLYQRSQNDTGETTDTTDTPPVVIDIEPTPEPTIEPEVTPTEIVEVTPVPNAEAVKLGEGETLSPVLFYQGNGIAYLNSQGQLFQADLLETGGRTTVGNIQELVIPQRSNLVRVLWPNSGNNFMVERNELGNRRFSVYVSDKGEYVDLPEQVISVAWMPGGQQILYVWTEADGKSNLNIANADNTGWTTITDMWEPDNAISVSPDGRSVAFYQTKNEIEPNKINLVTIDGKVFKSAVKDGLNAGAVWSPDSRFLAFARSVSGRPILHIANLNNGNIQNTEIEISALDKLVWSSDSRTIYAGGLDSGSSGREVLFRYNLSDGSLSSYDIGQVDIREPFLNSTSSALFFRNASDSNKLYSIGLNGLSN